MSKDYVGRRVALLTQHGKEKTMAPILEAGLGCNIEHVTGFDTDLLGTFTGETARVGTQLEAARRKTRAGMAPAQSTLGLASEGSFGPDPFTGLFPWNVEMMVWIDDDLGLEIVGVFQARPEASTCCVRSGMSDPRPSARSHAARRGVMRVSGRKAVARPSKGRNEVSP